MAERAGGAPQTADWLHPPVESEGLSRYLATLRERLWLVVLVVAITTGLAILYVATATKTYEAEATLLVSAVAPGDTELQGLPLITQSSDPTRDVTTASQFATTIDVAERVADELGLEGDPELLLENVTAEPVAQSNIVAITARADSPADAAAIANAFAEATVADRTEQLHDGIDERLPELEKQQKENPSNQLAEKISTLQQLRSGPDPTIQVETEATEPTAPVSPRPLFSIFGGLVGGLVLGAAAAFAAQGLDPRLRREEQLRRLYRLPVLARIPRETKRTPNRPLGPRSVSPAVGEAFRSLRGTVSMVRGGGGSRAILVTGSSPSEGKTTTGINLAASLAATGRSVILIEADLRRPSVGRALAMSAKRGVVSVLIESVDLEEALVSSDQFGPNLRLLLADYEGGWISELFALPAALKMIDDAKAMADYVIIDSPPLTDVVDTLPLARYVDDVLIVVRPGTTRLNKLTQLGELLAENGVRPMGFAVVGTAGPARSEKSYYTEQRDSMLHRDPEQTDQPVA